MSPSCRTEDTHRRSGDTRPSPVLQPFFVCPSTNHSIIHPSTRPSPIHHPPVSSFSQHPPAFSPCRSYSGLCSTSPPPPSRRTDTGRSTGRRGNRPAVSIASCKPPWNPGGIKQNNLNIKTRMKEVLELTQEQTDGEEHRVSCGLTEVEEVRVPCRCRWCSCRVRRTCRPRKPRCETDSFRETDRTPSSGLTEEEGGATDKKKHWIILKC